MKFFSLLIPLFASCAMLPMAIPGEGFLPFSDGFETGTLDRWHFEAVDPNFSMALVTNEVHSGSTALKVTLRQGDKIHNGTRSEAALYHVAPYGAEVLYQFAFFIPLDYSESSDWQLIAQFHDQPDFYAGEIWTGYQPLSPPVSFTYKNGLLILTMNTPGNETVRVTERTIAKGVWHQVALRAFWSEGPDGWIEAQLDNTVWTERYYRPNLYSRGGNYFKLGLYRSPDITTTNSIYYDDVEVRL